MTAYRIVKHLNDGLVLIDREDSRGVERSLWAAAKTRKPHKCAVSGHELPPGSQMFAPLGNSLYRYERIDANVINQAANP